MKERERVERRDTWKTCWYSSIWLGQGYAKDTRAVPDYVDCGKLYARYEKYARKGDLYLAVDKVMQVILNQEISELKL